jgi:acetyl-CoA synthetase
MKMTDKISSHLKELRTFTPSAQFSKSARISSLAEYERIYKESIENPEEFWSKQAKENLQWFDTWGETLESDFASVGVQSSPYLRFFCGARINASFNCLDRHLAQNAKKTAIIWQGENEDETRELTYEALHLEVSKFANSLKSLGVKKGSTVTIFMPMIPELAIAVLACARIGAIHSVVFSAFSVDSLRNRIQDCGAEVVITSDVGFHAGKIIPLKEKTDQAVKDCETVRHVVVYNRGSAKVSFVEGRDVWWHELMQNVDANCPAEHLDSEDPLFILYTSGSTGKPKGVMHTNGGYLLYAHLTCKYVFDLKPTDVYWCTADVGWITGHSYLIYGPLSNGATAVMFEGVPTYPEPNRFWKIIEKNKVTIFYTAPTAIRALMKLGESWPNAADLSSLRLLGTVGEPINPEAWIWYHKTIGKERCPIVDTWWQTETGGIMITTLPGAMPTKPGSAGKPFFGIKLEILKDDGAPAEVNEGGSLVITNPWPGMLRGVYGDAKSELVKNVYFSKFPGKYFTGDGCRRDEDGYYWLLGRIDDVINVSAHRFATAEIESALVSHFAVAEAAVVGFPHEVKGQGIYCFVTIKDGFVASLELEKEIILQVRKEIGPIATPDFIQFAPALPKTRSGKIMRRILRKIAEGLIEEVGDVSTLADPSVVESLIREAKSLENK